MLMKSSVFFQNRVFWEKKWNFLEFDLSFNMDVSFLLVLCCTLIVVDISFILRRYGLKFSFRDILTIFIGIWQKMPTAAKRSSYLQILLCSFMDVRLKLLCGKFALN